MALGMVIALLVAMVAGIPVAIAIALAGIVGIVLFSNLPLVIVAQQFYVALDNFPLVAIPLFILAGNLMEAGGVSSRLVAVAKSLVGHGPGGLPATCVVTCLIFGAVSGSSVATTFAVGAILIPALVRQGYPAPFAAALQAASAELAVIIPPSIPLILYGVSTNTSIGDLFMAGILPGLLLALAMVTLVFVWSRLKGYGRAASEDIPAAGKALREGVLALLMPIIVVGGIYGGVFTPTESAVIAVFYAMALGGLVYRQLTLASLVRCLTRTAISASFILMTLAAAGLFTFLINRTGAPAELAQWLTSVFSSQVTFLLAINVLLFLVGMFIETAAAIIVLAPLLLPVAVSLGIDPVHFGIVMIVNMALGMVTPPLGVNLYAACVVAGLRIEKIAPYLIPFILVAIACLALITYAPAISLSLPAILDR
ncbi:MAG: TRAP transporter large permease [Acuticoccus sp.]